MICVHNNIVHTNHTQAPYTQYYFVTYKWNVHQHYKALFLFIPKGERKLAVKLIPHCTTRSRSWTYYAWTVINGQWRKCWGQVQRNYCYGGCYSYHFHSHFNYAFRRCSCCKPQKFSCDKIPMKLSCGQCDTLAITYERVNPEKCTCIPWYV